MNFSGKTIVVTGTTSVIGAETVRIFKEKGSIGHRSGSQ